MAKIDKVCVVYGGFYPRSRKVFGCGGKGTAEHLFHWQARTPAVDADVDPPKRKRPPFISLRTLRPLRLNSSADFVRDPRRVSAAAQIIHRTKRLRQLHAAAKTKSFIL